MGWADIGGDGYLSMRGCACGCGGITSGPEDDHTILFPFCTSLSSLMVMTGRKRSHISLVPPFPFSIPQMNISRTLEQTGWDTRWLVKLCFFSFLFFA